MHHTQEHEDDRKRVLIVDDEPHLRLLYEREFRRAGFETLTAPDAAQGLENVIGMAPDLVVLDIRMPGKDGVELMNEIIEHDRSVPVIINTAYSSYRDSYLTWAADAFLVKSGDVSGLIRTARKLTGRGESRDAPAGGGAP
jgi:DNA-binding response OmpR family regulator